MRPVGESEITYDDIDRPHSWRTHSTSRRLQVQLVGTIVESAGGGEVSLRTTLQPTGLFRLLGPLVARTMSASWNNHLAVIRRTLEAEAAH